jgi:glycerol-3-phosphate dehydrogenase
MTNTQYAEINERIEALSRDGVDVLILGAGVNGAGLFRDLCEQGLDCLIVDKGDFSSGTSAAPSRLIHGGIKYLETGEFRLVAQSTLERNLLLRNAPHLVDPLPTIIPIFSWIKGIPAALRTLLGSTTAPRSRGAALVKIGMSIYDFYGSKARVMPRHRFFSRASALREMPGLTPSIVGAGLYYDARIHAPERLVLELAKDGMAANPKAAALNSTELVEARDGLVTFRRHDGSSFSVRPKLVVNAAGPWIDRVNGLLGEETRLIGGTKGSHILLKHDELIRRLNGRMIYFEADDGRICLVFDYLGRALVGSTDIPARDPDNVRCEDDEIEYFLASLRSLLPGLEFDRSQIVYTYAGIRPLPASDASNPGLISRDHSAPLLEPRQGRPFPVISLVGGKWTTFRGFAEEVADTVLARFGITRRRSTRELPIGGGHGYPAEAAARRFWVDRVSELTGADRERVEELLARYGTTAEAILGEDSGFSDKDRLTDAPDYSLAELAWIARHELVVHLADLVLRRTTMAIRGVLTARDLHRIAELVADVLQWNEARREEELRQTLTILERDHGLRF